MFKTRYFLLIIVIAAQFVLGCSTNPVTGKQELSLLSSNQEINIGEKNYGSYRQAQGGDYYLDPSLQSYVSGVGAKLTQVSDAPNLPYEFVVLNNSMPNAWALPGGKIAINRGLLAYLEDEAQLAAVLAHEIVHAAARHGASQMTRGALTNLGLIAIGAGIEGKTNTQLYDAASQVGIAAWMSKYGREDELESDYYGMEYMVRAGYDPQGAVELQKAFVALNKGSQPDFVNALFASHPPSQKRLEANQVNAKNYPSGRRYRQRYQNAIAQVIKDQPAYDFAKQAHEKLRKKQPKEALRDLDKAILAQNNEFSFWLMRGYAWAMLDNDKNAELAFTTSIIKNPAHYKAYLERGILLYDQGQREKGISDIRRSHAILPTAKGSYYLGEQEMAMKNYARAKSYYSEASNSPGKFRELAEQKMMVADQNLNPKKYIQAKVVIVEPAQVGIKLTNLGTVSIHNVQIWISNGKTTQNILWNKNINSKKSAIIRSQFKVGVSSLSDQFFQVGITKAVIAP